MNLGQKPDWGVPLMLSVTPAFVQQMEPYLLNFINLHFASSCYKSSLFTSSCLLIHRCTKTSAHISPPISPSMSQAVIKLIHWSLQIDVEAVIISGTIYLDTSTSRIWIGFPAQGRIKAINHKSFVSADSFRLHNGLYRAESGSTR